MKVSYLDYADVPQFSARDKAYQSTENPFAELMAYEPTLSSFEQAIADRKKHIVDRSLLVEVINEQYKGIANNEAVLQNAERLLDNDTFTIITAHQPSLFTGPLYYIHKIFSAINLAEKLAKEYSSHQFVPVFITGGEDHDFDEINKAHIFNKTIIWEQDKGGSVGRLSKDSLSTAISQLQEILSDRPNGEQLKAWVTDAYDNSNTYADFAQRLTHHIFGQYGLVVLNMDNVKLKQAFIPILKKELIERPSQALVQETQSKIEQLGYSAQAHARAINLFYLMDGARERIVHEQESYKVLNTDIVWTEQQVLEELQNHPERFSPNVIMRPLYQESILPNLAYVGGGGELAYWLERKQQFAHFGVYFPMLVRRASAMILSKSQIKSMNQLQLSDKEIFADTDSIISNYLEKSTEVELSLDSEKEAFMQVFRDIADKAKMIDPTLVQKINAESAKQSKIIDQLESRLKRTVKSKEEVMVNKIKKLKDKLYPNRGLQERYDNFMEYYDMLGAELLQALKKNIDPLNKQMLIIHFD